MRYLLLLAFLFIYSFSFSQADLFVEANQAYINKDYKKAVDLYEQIRAAEQDHNAELNHNLGLAYLQQDSIGEAILYFEKALKADPTLDEAIQNLEFSNNKLDSLYLNVEEVFLFRWWRAFYLMFSSNFWAILSLLLLTAAMVLYLNRLFQWKSFRYADSISLIIGLVFLGLISMAAAKQRATYGEVQNTAIIMQASMLKSGPDERSEDKAELAKGEKVWIIDQIDDWSKVSIRNKQYGWVNNADYMVV